MLAADSLNLIVLLVFGVYSAVCAGVGHSIGVSVKRPFLGFWFGLLLGVVGLLLLGVAQAKGAFDD